MREYKNLLCSWIVLIIVAFNHAYADNCAVPLTVTTMEQTDDVSSAALDHLSNRLSSIMSSNGTVTGISDTRFFIAGKFSHISDDVLAGPPKQYSVHSDLTIYVGDADSETLFGSTTLDLRGVGNSKQRALINAMRIVNENNPKLKKLLEQASEKVIAYYDANSSQILAKAKKAAAVQNYDEALYYAFSIPECCKSYGKAVNDGLEYYQQYINVNGRKLYEQARAYWTAQPNAEGASQALPILLQIPVGSSVYPEAEKLVKEISEVVKDDKYFEERKKYQDAVDIKKMQIQSAKEIGVAWGKGQQPKTTNIAWIR